jgi:hypothetical protein
MKSPSTLRIAGMALAVGAALAGCGGSNLEAYLQIAPNADYDHYFYDIPKTDAALNAMIDRNIERLAGPSWERAKEYLFSSGKPAILRLIANLERTEPTHLGLISQPGRAVPEKALEWKLGDVVYSVLVEFIGSYTDYSSEEMGPIPSKDIGEWDKWYSKRQRDLNVKQPIDTAPKYVREQFREVELALKSRFVDVRDQAKKAEDKAAKNRKAQQKKQKKIEQDRKARAEAHRKKVQAEAAAKEKERAAEQKRKEREEEAAAKKAAADKAAADKAAADEAAADEAAADKAAADEAAAEQPTSDQPQDDEPPANGEGDQPE